MSILQVLRCWERSEHQQLLDMISTVLDWGFRWPLPISSSLALRDNWNSMLPAELQGRLQRKQLPTWVSSLYCCYGNPPGSQPRIRPSVFPLFHKHLIPSKRSYVGWFVSLMTLTDIKNYRFLHTSWSARSFIHFISTTLKIRRIGNKVESISISKVLVKRKTLRLKRIN